MRILLSCLVLFVVYSCKGLVDLEEENKTAPYEWEAMVRSYPDTAPDWTAFEEISFNERTRLATLKIASGFNGAWTLEGPANTGGRFNCLAVHPTNPAIIYAGAASGGIWKTTDGGQNWIPVFDQQSFLAIGELVIDPNNPDHVYAGTGDRNISGYCYIGNGIWKSTDAGVTWSYLGLGDSKIISQIILAPGSNGVIYASAMGNPFLKDNNRGVYKSTDNGVTWTQVLFVSDSAGVIDLVMDPFNPQVLYASSFNRIRTTRQSLAFGPDSKIWKTTDGGASWQAINNGIPVGSLSRINLAVSNVNPNVVFASLVNDQFLLEGIYKSTNGGANWVPINTSGIDPFALGGFGWYFGRIFIHPANDDHLYLCGIEPWKTQNGGLTWEAPSFFPDVPHADIHDIIFLNNDSLYLASDGGLYKSDDDGLSWLDMDNIPNNQFYRIAWSPTSTGLYAGGVQDNGTNMGNAAMLNSWYKVFGADGFGLSFHPTNPAEYWVEYQNGGLQFTTDNGFSFSDGTTGIDPADRRNWDMPYIRSPHNPDHFLTGTFQPYLNLTGTAVNWTVTGPDLTDGIVFNPRFHTISTLDWSPLNLNRRMAGTSDGNVWITSSNGLIWNNITAGLPDRYVTSVKFSPNTSGRIYATLSGYKVGEYIPRVFRSDNFGQGWTDISGDLPQWAVNDIYPYPGSDSILFAGTDGGVYATLNAGINWYRLGNNMPIVPVYDLDMEPVDRKLLAGTYARSMYSFPVDTLLLSTGLDYVTVDAALKAGPSPFTDAFSVYSSWPDPLEGKVYDLKGRQLTGFHLNKGETRIESDGWPAGVYIISVTHGRNRLVRRLVKQ
jgi:photosystem II stability/assembly factor-like uncharacterized protein